VFNVLPRAMSSTFRENSTQLLNYTCKYLGIIIMISVGNIIFVNIILEKYELASDRVIW
jgi:hypothetical protein